MLSQPWQGVLAFYIKGQFCVGEWTSNHNQPNQISDNQNTLWKQWPVETLTAIVDQSELFLTTSSVHRAHELPLAALVLLWVLKLVGDLTNAYFRSGKLQVRIQIESSMTDVL